MSAIANVSTHADRAARWSAIALGFSIPISVALDSILSVVVLLGWLASGRYREKLTAIVSSPVSIAALMLYAVLVIGTAYGERFPGDGASFLVKYADLLLIPVFACCFRDASDRRRGLHAFIASLILTLALSFVVKAGWLSGIPFIKGSPASANVFKIWLTHNILMAFGAFLFFNLSLSSRTPRARWIWLGLAVLAGINVLLMVKGRTGYVMLGALIVYGGYCWHGWRGFTGALVMGAALGTVLAVTPNPARQRVELLVKEFQSYRPGKPNPDSSLGERLDFYRNSVAVIGDHPLVGSGTGSFPKAYSDKIRRTGIERSDNPHNEYLLITVQTGLIGLAFLLHLFWRHWRLAPRLATPFETHLSRGLLLTFVVGCLFNSLLLDHTEGLLFAWMTGLLYGGLKSQEIGNRK